MAQIIEWDTEKTKKNSGYLKTEHPNMDKTQKIKSKFLFATSLWITTTEDLKKLCNIIWAAFCKGVMFPNGF